MNNHISTYKFNKAELNRQKKFLEKQIIPDPTEELLEIYEKRILYELSYLRAEKYDSPEHAKELKRVQIREKNDIIPRNIQNPNFDKLMDYYNKIIGPKTEQSFSEIIKIHRELYDFMMSFNFVPRFEYKLQYLDPLPDPRCIETDIVLYMAYLLTKARFVFHRREIVKFDKLTQKEFDSESISETLLTLKFTRDEGNKLKYEEFGNEILSSFEDSANKYKIYNGKDDPDPPKLVEEAESIVDFLNYLWESQT
tara:strand:+ start:1887 stop:2645 length:759 start_codon:yes stop_codon:yes gene_type:complete